MALENVSKALFGIIVVMFLIFGLLPTMLNVISLAPQPDPILTGLSYFLVLFFVAITIYAAFKGDDDNSGIPALPSV